MDKVTQAKSASTQSAAAQSALLQTKCTCGTSKTSDQEQCEGCKAAQSRGAIAIDASNSALEQEADSVAAKVSSGHSAGAISSAAAAVQRAGKGAATSEAPASVQQVLNQPGQPLNHAVQDKIQRRFGHNFSNVRIHTDASAAQSANAINARAYTVGNHIAFASGQYNPTGRNGQRLLAHELTHVVQQSGQSAALASRSSNTRGEEEDEEMQTRQDEETSLLSRAPAALLQRDFAIEPPNPDAEPDPLSAEEIQEAIDYNNDIVAPVGAAGIAHIRDVLAISAQPAVIDADFVNAVLRWQAMQGLPEDGKLGPRTAGPLFREIGAEGGGRGELASGPTYAPTATISPPVVGGTQRAFFRMRADFKHDPANKIFASCCEVRQFIRWDAASATAMGGVPHGGFPAGWAANTWIEDRDSANKRYGHRTGPRSDPASFDQYLDTNGIRNQAFGHRYRGSDSPGGPAALLAGSWRFRLQVIDVCNGNRVVGNRDYVRVNW